MNADEAEKVLFDVFNNTAKTYDCCGNVFFEPLAEELIERAGIEEGSRVLDLGTGTGIAAFKALERTGTKGYILGIDGSEVLLALAEERSRDWGMDNVEFKMMSMSSLDLPAGSFDHVIGNFSFCCCFFYERALAEAYRVLKPGGKLTYNHWGPSESPVELVLDAVFSKQKVKEPSECLLQAREAFILLNSSWSRFKDPFVALEALKAVGFMGREASISYAQQVFSDVEGFLDYRFTEDLTALELSEMLPEQRNGLRMSLKESLKPFLSKAGLVVTSEILHFSGCK